jgi:hypothetical protein
VKLSPTSTPTPDPAVTAWAIANSPLVATVVGGLLVLLLAWVASVIYKKARGASLWRRVWVGVRGLFTIRVQFTTTGRIADEAELAETERQAAALRADQARKVAEIDGWKRASDRMKPNMEALAQQVKRLKEDLERQSEENNELREQLNVANETIKRKGQGFAVPPPNLPPLSPRWALVPLEANPEEHGPRYRRWKLVNMAEDSAAYNVRIEPSPKERYQFTTGGTWKDMSGQTERVFGGQIDEEGARQGYTLTVWWSEGDDEFFPRQEFQVAASEDVWGQPLREF